MPGPTPTERLRITPRSAILAVAMLGLALALIRLFAAAGRVIGWILMAAAVAGLLHPVVAWLGRRIPRLLAVLAVLLGLLGFAGLVGYGLVDDITRETRNLQQAAPKRAAQLERSGRFGELARDANLAERTRRLVRSVPERLRGGTPAEALRATATRGVAFLATAVLTLFFLLHGPRLAQAAIEQLPDAEQRRKVGAVAAAAYRRAFGYATGTVGMAIAAGLVAYAAARVAAIPGPAPLAVWMALWDMVPVLGAAIGALPIIALAAAVSTGKGVVLAVVFLAYQVLETAVVQRQLERRTMKLGPFLTVAGGVAGLELYGIAGALLTVLALALAAAAFDEVAGPAEME